jgi:hypothetical protein
MKYFKPLLSSVVILAGGSSWQVHLHSYAVAVFFGLMAICNAILAGAALSREK